MTFYCLNGKLFRSNLLWSLGLISPRHATHLFLPYTPNNNFSLFFYLPSSTSFSPTFTLSLSFPRNDSESWETSALLLDILSLGISPAILSPSLNEGTLFIPSFGIAGIAVWTELRRTWSEPGQPFLWRELPHGRMNIGPNNLVQTRNHIIIQIPYAYSPPWSQAEHIYITGTVHIYQYEMDVHEREEWTSLLQDIPLIWFHHSHVVVNPATCFRLPDWIILQVLHGW